MDEAAKIISTVDWTGEIFVLYGILIFIWAENIWNMYLMTRQIGVYQTNTVVPIEVKDILTTEEFQKARLYGLDKAWFSVVKTLFSVSLASFIIYDGIFFKVWRYSEDVSIWMGFSNELTISGLFIFFFNLFSTVMDIPFSVYYTFVVEKNHGFNKQTPGFFIKDNIKQFFVMQLLSIPLSVGIVAVVQWGGDYFFVWLWMVVCGVSILFMTIYPEYIAPLFDKFTPLQEGRLRLSIEKLAASLKFPLEQLYVVEGSKRSAHSNAYFTGMFGSKRIVLFDTLLHKVNEETKEETGCSDEEILAVLGHELGHWKLNHIFLRITLLQVNLFLLFCVFALMFQHPPLYTAIGFPVGVKPILVGLISVIQLVMAPYNALMTFGLTVWSRVMEFQADEFAAKLGFSDPLKHALLKLNKDNLGFPVSDWLYSTWNHSHPTLLQRMAKLREFTKPKSS